MAQEPEERESAEEESDNESTRKPYIVVTMSAEFKESAKAFAEKHDTTITGLVRTLLAKHIGYDLKNEPEPQRRKKYETPEEKEAAHKLASKKSGLLRKALFQAHNAQIKGRKALLAAANKLTLDLADSDNEWTMETLEAADKVLSEAIKAGK
jgi:hypothetical protein